MYITNTAACITDDTEASHVKNNVEVALTPLHATCPASIAAIQLHDVAATPLQELAVTPLQELAVTPLYT